MKVNQYIREVEPVFKNSKNTSLVTIERSKDVYKLFSDLCDYTQEKFVVVHLNNKNEVMCFQLVHQGTISSCQIHPADVLRTSLLVGATAIVLIHNHPSGDPKPSECDLEITKVIQKACEIFNLKVLDHLIIGIDTYFSFADENILQGGI